jgi:hypothetical protein
MGRRWNYASHSNTISDDHRRSKKNVTGVSDPIRGGTA